MNNKKIFVSMLLILVLILCGVSTTALAAEKNEESKAELKFNLPGWDKKEVAEGYSKEAASKMQLKIKAEYPYEALYGGFCGYTLCVDETSLSDGTYGIVMEASSSNSESYLLFSWYNITVENGIVTNSDALREGNKAYLQGSYSYSVPEGYNTESNVLMFTITTNSSVSKAIGPITISDMFIQDNVNGYYAVDFGKCAYKCVKYNDDKGTRTPWQFEVKKAGKAVNVSKNKIKANAVSPEASQRDSVLFSIPGYDADQMKNGASMKDAGTAVFSFREKIPFPVLSQGYGMFTFCVYDEDLKEGIYNWELKLNHVDMPWGQGYGNEKFEVKDGNIILNSWDLVITHLNDKTYFTRIIRYSLPEAVHPGSDMIELSVKTDSDTLQEMGPVYLVNYTLIDSISGVHLADLTKTECSAEKVNEPMEICSELAVTKGKEGRALWLVQQPDCILTGETYPLQIVSELYDSLKLTYSSSNKAVATVNKSGQVKGVKEGTTTITVKDSVHQKEYSFELVVRNPYFAFISEKSTVHVGQTYYVMAKAIGFTPKKVTYKVGDTKVGTIDAKTGLFTAKKEGKTKVYVTDSNGHTSQMVMTVLKDTRDPKKHVTIVPHEKVTKADQDFCYNQVLQLYNKIMDYYGTEGYEPYIEIKFAYLEGTGSAAYATKNSDYDDELHWNIVIGISTIHSGQNMCNVITHELSHVAQCYTKCKEIWLQEGLAEYSAYHNTPDRQAAYLSLDYNASSYQDGYGRTAAFIQFVSEKYCPGMGQYLNELLQRGEYSEAVWKEATGYSVEQMWTAFYKYGLETQWWIGWGYQ